MPDEPAAASPSDPLIRPQEHPPQGGPSPDSKKKRRRWPFVILGLLLVLTVLVILAPTIAGTAPVRSFILSKVNANLNGRVEVAGWSAGWTSGMKVEGVRVFDAQNAQILELKSLTTELSLLDAARGKLHLGKVVVEGLNALAKSDAEGTLNFAKLVKESPKPPSDKSPSPAPQQPPAELTKLPDVSGELHLVNCSATYEDGRSVSIGGTGQTFHFPSIAGVVKFPDLNRTIEDSIDVAVKVGDQPPGRITIAGTADIAEGGIVQVDKASVDQTLTIEDIRAESFSFALGKDGGIQKLAGLTNGKVVVKVVPSGDATLDVNLKSQDVMVAGPALKGGTYQTKALDIVVPNVVVNRSADPSDFAKWLVKAGTDQQPVSVKVDQGTITLAADAPVGALLNIADNKAPGAAGFLRTNVDFNIGDLAKQLPAMFAVKEGLAITGGRLKQTTDVALSADRAVVKALTLDLTDVAGTDSARNNAAVKLEPIHVGVTATSLGGGAAVPDLRDLKLTIQSAFANGLIEGRTIAETNGTVTADLRMARDELSKVIDLGTLQLDGKLAIDLSSKGNLVADKRATVSLVVNADDLKVDGMKETPPILEPHLRLLVKATTFGGDKAVVERVEDLSITARAGDEQRPTLLMELLGKRIDLPAGNGPSTASAAKVAGATAPSSVVAQGVQLKQLRLNLAQAQREFGAFVPALKEMGLDVTSGTLDVTAGASYDGQAADYAATVALAGVNLNKTPKPAAGAAAIPARVVLANYGATIGLVGKYAALPNGRAQITVSQLSADGKLFAVTKAGDRDLSLITGPAGMVPTGELIVGADLKQLNDLVAALSDGPAVVVAQNGKPAGLRSGRLQGVIALQPGDAGQFKVATRDMQLADLTATGEGGAAALTNETLAIDLQARPRSDFSAVDVDRFAVNGKLATVSVEKAQIVLTIGKDAAARPATVPEMVQAAVVRVNVPDLAPVQSLLDALSPPPTAATLAGPLPEAYAQVGRVNPGAGQAKATGAAAPTPPTKLGGGSLSLTLNVVKQGERTVVATDVTGKGVVLAAGAARDTISDLAVSTQFSYVPVAPLAPAAVKPGGPPASQPSVLESLRDVQVPKFDVSVVHANATTPVVKLALAEPLSVSQPSALGNLFASLSDPKVKPLGDVVSLRTALKGNGDLGELMALLKVFNADASADRPYAGSYTLDQKLSAGKEGITATGVISVADLSVVGTTGTFTEKSVKLANDVSLDAGQQLLSIRNVSLAMEATKALELSLKGNVKDLSVSRTLDGVSGTLGYDWAKVWQIVEPLLDVETKKGLKLTLAGKGSKPFSLAGSYPAGKPFNEAIRSVTGSFEVAFDQLNYNEIDTRNLSLPIALKDGIATVAYSGKPAGSNFPDAAACNGGFIRLGGVNVDLTGDPMRLNVPKGTKLLENVGLNPYFSDTLGDFINNPAFVSPQTASGTVNVTVEQCDKYPLAKLDPAALQRDPGRVVILLSMTKLHLGNPMIVGILGQVASRFGGGLDTDSLQGEVKESRIVMEKGEVHQELVIATGENGREIRLVGGANLQTQQLLGMNFVIGPQFLGKDVSKYLPEGLPIALGGTTRSVKWDVGRSANELLGNKIKDPKALGDLLGNVLGGNKQSKPATPAPNTGAANNSAGAKPAEQMQEPAGDDDIGGILGGLLGNGGKKETDKEKEERRARNRREKELEAQRKANVDRSAATQPATQPAVPEPDPKKKEKKRK